jgi:LysR family transcriptional regulator, nitrogen assimilation regulatory protein
MVTEIGAKYLYRVEIGLKVASRAIDLTIVFEDHPEGGFTREVLFHQRLYLASPRGALRVAPLTLQEIGKLPLVLPTPT